MNSNTNTPVLKMFAALLAVFVAFAAPVGMIGTAAAASYTVSGTVTTSGGDTVGNATVTIIDTSDGSVVTTVQTASDGTYSTSVAGGTYDVEATAPGYTLSLNQGITVDSNTTVNLTLFPSMIGGPVSDSDGNSIANASVQLIDPSDGSVVKTTTTDANGVYSVTPPAVGTYDVLVTADGYTSAVGTVDMTQTTTYSATLQTDSDGDGIADSSDAYPTEPRHEYTVDASDNKTVSSLYAEINATEEVTVTVEHNRTELANTTTTPSEAPSTVEVTVDETHGSYTVYVHGVSEEDVSSTGAFYESDSTGGGAGGDSSGNSPTEWVNNNPAVAALVAVVSLGAAAVVHEEL